MRPASTRGTVAAALLIAAALTGCTGADQPTSEPTARPVTSEEAQLLAITRFTNYDTGSRPFTTSLDVSGVETAMTGWVDYVSALGYASVTGSFGAEALLWTDGALGAIPSEPDAEGYPVLPIAPASDPDWQIQQLDPSASALDALLAAISALGSDRPDNPLLVQQSGALWLREDQVDGTAVTVFAAPPSDAPVEGEAPTEDASSLRLWVAASGLLLRAEVRLNDGWTTVDFPDAPAPTLELPEPVE